MQTWQINPITRYEPSSNKNGPWSRWNNMSAPMEPKTVQSWPVRAGTVHNVNWDDYTCTVVSDGARYERVRCLSPWFSCNHGHGINFCPESNSWVLITKGPGFDWFILGFIPIEQLKSNSDPETYFRDYKPELTEGDIHLSTDSGNFIFIQKSAHAIRLENTPACFIDMQAASNYIHIGCQNLLLQTKAGMITMKSAEPELVEDKDGKTRAKPVDVCTSGFFRSNVNDYKNFVKVDIGKVKLNNEGVPDNTIVAVNICDKVGILIDTDGNIKTYTAGTITNLSDKDITIATKAKMALKSDSNFSIDTKGSLSHKASGSITNDAGGSVTTNSGGSIAENASGTISNMGSAVTHGSGSGSPSSPDTSAQYPSIPDNSSNAKSKPFTITHLI